jgi:NAD(P)-dependent dehydrogenase (short-subunit alcohol dehydrogenase family)
MTDDRERWALILGASSGMGEATSLALAAAGYRIVGVHLDFRAGTRPRRGDQGGHRRGRQRGAVHQHERGRRREAAAAIETIRARFDESRTAGRHPYLRVVMHSLAFGSLVPFLTEDPKDGVDRKKMEMTQDVMANSLVYWVQDVWRAGFLETGSKIYAMTSEGTSRVVPSYGVVSGARPPSSRTSASSRWSSPGRAAGSRSTRSGPACTDTPALRKIPENQRMIDVTLARNPHGRMTTPQDVADAIVTLSETDSDWISGNIISVDGGEFVTG